MCGVTHWKYFSTALAAINEFSLRVVYIVNNIIILFYLLLYILLWMLSSVSKSTLQSIFFFPLFYGFGNEIFLPLFSFFQVYENGVFFIFSLSHYSVDKNCVPYTV